jgi:hypothetical protein
MVIALFEVCWRMHETFDLDKQLTASNLSLDSLLDLQQLAVALA